MSVDSVGPVAESMATLVRWLATVDADVTFAAPGRPTDGGPGLLAWPVQLLAEQEVRPSTRPGPLRLRVRYLVTGAGSGADLARLLDPVLVAAATATEVTVVLETVPAELWLAFGAPPRAALLVDVPAFVAR